MFILPDSGRPDDMTGGVTPAAPRSRGLLFCYFVIFGGINMNSAGPGRSAAGGQRNHQYLIIGSWGYFTYISLHFSAERALELCN